jgi:hypothetical protein
MLSPEMEMSVAKFIAAVAVVFVAALALGVVLLVLYLNSRSEEGDMEGVGLIAHELGSKQLSVMVNPFLPDNAIMVSRGTYERIKDALPLKGHTGELFLVRCGCKDCSKERKAAEAKQQRGNLTDWERLRQYQSRLSSLIPDPTKKGDKL